jgi:hypothetical protein
MRVLRYRWRVVLVRDIRICAEHAWLPAGSTRRGVRGMVDPGSLVVSARWEGGWWSPGSMRQFELLEDVSQTPAHPPEVEYKVSSLDSLVSHQSTSQP